MPRSPFLDRVRSTLRLRHYSYRTEQAYLYWIEYLIRFNGTQHPARLGTADVKRFRSDLAVNRGVAAATQNQALNALNFLYRHVLEQSLGDIAGTVRAKRPQRLPVVLSREEVAHLLQHVDPAYSLVAALMYGAGLRLMECLRLRVKDVDFDRHCIVVRAGKGNTDRTTLLPQTLEADLRTQRDSVDLVHRRDIAAGFGSVALPGALARKYPNAAREPGWQFLFPARHIARDPAAGSPVATTSTRRTCRKPSSRQFAGPASASPRAPIPSGIPSRPTCWNRATTSAPSRSCSVMPTCEPPRFTPTC